MSMVSKVVWEAAAEEVLAKMEELEKRMDYNFYERWELLRKWVKESMWYNE